MLDFITKLKQEVDEKIRAIESVEKNILKRASVTSDMLEDAFDQLKDFIVGYTFPDEQHEILFFKEIKPRFFCRLLFYRKVYNIERDRPIGTEEEQTRYLNSELEQIQHYISKRLDFYRYVRSGAAHLDREYYLRGNRKEKSQYLDSFYFERDPMFSTNGDFRVAKILANDMLQVYLKEELEEIRLNRFTLSETPEVHLDTPRWTEIKAGLIEILYAWDALRCIDNGNISLSRMTAYFEQTFDIRLGNTSRAFSEMKYRSNPTAFLDRMKEALIERINELEDKNVKNNLNRNAMGRRTDHIIL